MYLFFSFLPMYNLIDRYNWLYCQTLYTSNLWIKYTKQSFETQGAIEQSLQDVLGTIAYYLSHANKVVWFFLSSSSPIGWMLDQS